jgi:hypothetical protein
MKTVEIKTQEQFDKLPKKFKVYTRVFITSDDFIVVKMVPQNSSVEARGNSSVVAWENSSVKAWENSSVEAWGNSSVEAWENSSVEAWGNSSVVARGNSSVVAWENSSVKARENSSVVAWGNSSVVARGNSSVVAWGNSSVVAWENSSVVARGNSSVEAWGNSILRIFSSYAKCESGQSVVSIIQDCDPAINKLLSSIPPIKTETVLHTTDSFCEIYKPDDNGFVTLFKSVNPNGMVDFWSGKIEYKIDSEIVCPDFDNDPTRQCGGGLHLSPSKNLALSYNRGTVLKCLVHKDDIVVYGRDISKVRCRMVRPVEVVWRRSP